MELSVERVEKDKLEIKHFGYSATDIYVDYRVVIDTNIKRIMNEISEAYNEKRRDTKQLEVVNASLYTNYLKFWDMVEPQMRAFYEDLQKTLDVSKNIKPSKNINTKKEMEQLEKDIETLRVEIVREEYYLKSLQQYNEILDKEFLPLNDQVKDYDKKLSKVINREYEKHGKIKEKLGNKVRDDICKQLEAKPDCRLLYKIDHQVKVPAVFHCYQNL